MSVRLARVWLRSRHTRQAMCDCAVAASDSLGFGLELQRICWRFWLIRVGAFCGDDVVVGLHAEKCTINIGEWVVLVGWLVCNWRMLGEEFGYSSFSISLYLCVCV